MKPHPWLLNPPSVLLISGASRAISLLPPGLLMYLKECILHHGWFFELIIAVYVEPYPTTAVHDLCFSRPLDDARTGDSLSLRVLPCLQDHSHLLPRAAQRGQVR